MVEASTTARMAAMATTTTCFSSRISCAKRTLTSPEFGILPLVRTNAISLELYSASLPSFLRNRRRPGFLPCSIVQDITVHRQEVVKSVDNIEDEEVNRTKLYVVNIPWDYSVSDLENLFGQFGTVDGVEIISHKNGKSRGFAFVTMSSAEEAQVAVEKLESFELSGRIIRVELAKSFKKPDFLLDSIDEKSRNWIYVSNLAWKVRSTNLREFFSAKFKPVSAKVIFEGQTGKSAGYGFISFATIEEAMSVISEFNGKELMGRPLALKLSEKGDDKPDAA